MAPTNLECRMYPKKFPDVDTPVMVQVTSINAPTCAYVSLLEYNNIEGMLTFTELSSKRIRSVAGQVRVGRVEPVMVLHVDPVKGFVNVSKRMLSKEDKKACEDKYDKSKHVHSILRHVAETMAIDLEDLYIHVGWPLYKKYGHAYDAFKLIASDPDSVLNSLTPEVEEVNTCSDKVSEFVMSEEVKKELIHEIGRRITPQAVKLRADIELTCNELDGILHIKEAMRKAEAAGNNDCPVKVSLVGPPSYALNTQAIDKQQGVETLNKAIMACEEEIRLRQGSLVLKTAPRAVNERDDNPEQVADDHNLSDDEVTSSDLDSEEETDTEAEI